MKRGEKIIIIVGSVFLLFQLFLYLLPSKKIAPEAIILKTSDSSNAYNSVDSIKKMVLPVLPKDSAPTIVQLPNAINTKNVSPKEIIDFATTLIGIPYSYGSTDPKTGFDCSGFITYVFKHFNIIVPRSSIDFTNVGRTISEDSAQTGDIILFTGTDSTEKFVGHMGLIVSNENKQLNFIHSSSGKKHGVTITPMNDYYKSRYVKTIRIFNYTN